MPVGAAVLTSPTSRTPSTAQAKARNLQGAVLKGQLRRCDAHQFRAGCEAARDQRQIRSMSDEGHQRSPVQLLRPDRGEQTNSRGDREEDDSPGDFP